MGAIWIAWVGMGGHRSCMCGHGCNLEGKCRALVRCDHVSQPRRHVNCSGKKFSMPQLCPKIPPINGGAMEWKSVGLPHGSSWADWLVDGCSPPPSPNHPNQVSVSEKCPWDPAWKPWLMFFNRWSGWGSGVALVWVSYATHTSCHLVNARQLMCVNDDLSHTHTWDMLQWRNCTNQIQTINVNFFSSSPK